MACGAKRCWIFNEKGYSARDDSPVAEQETKRVKQYRRGRCGRRRVLPIFGFVPSGRGVLRAVTTHVGYPGVGKVAHPSLLCRVKLTKQAGARNHDAIGTSNG